MFMFKKVDLMGLMH